MAPNLKGVQTIGIVDDDAATLAPIAQYLLKKFFGDSPKPQVQQILTRSLGHKKKAARMTNFAKGFLQEQGIRADFYNPFRLSKGEIKKCDLVLCMDQFQVAAIVHGLMVDPGEEGKIVVFLEAAGERGDILDPHDDVDDFKEASTRILAACQKIAKRIGDAQ